MSSAAIGEDKETIEQLVCTSSTIDNNRGKQAEEKEETRDKEDFSIQTFVELKKLGTPNQTL